MIKSDSKGFTLIELLVVVAILGLLATIVAVSLTGARSRARDGRRSSDLRQIELGLELYYSANRQYPEDLGALVTEGYLNMASTPEDPGTGNAYCYAYGQDTNLDKQRQYYHLGAVLENSDSDLLAEDKDASGNTSCGSTCSWIAGVETANSDCNWTNGASKGNEDNFDGADTEDYPTYDRAILPN